VNFSWVVDWKHPWSRALSFSIFFLLLLFELFSDSFINNHWYWRVNWSYWELINWWIICILVVACMMIDNWSFLQVTGVSSNSFETMYKQQNFKDERAKVCFNMFSVKVLMFGLVESILLLCQIYLFENFWLFTILSTNIK
jgi:hypothetical protein